LFSILGVVDKIVVKNTDTQEHELMIEFRLPYVGDKMAWNDDENKSKGYILKNGKRSKVLRVNLLKKALT
jgi:glycerol-3-phosphate cytidylyltransferase-like family protein